MRLGACLAALGPGLKAGLIREVIFADSGSTDDTATIAEAVGARLLAPEAVPSEVRGAWVMLLPSETVLGADWPDAVERHVADHPDAGAWFPLRRHAGLSWRETAQNLAARWLSRPSAAQGLLSPGAALRKAGGIGHAGLVAALAGRLRRLDAVATDASLGEGRRRAISRR